MATVSSPEAAFVAVLVAILRHAACPISPGAGREPYPGSIFMLFGMIGVGARFVLNYFRYAHCGKLFAITW